MIKYFLVLTVGLSLVMIIRAGAIPKEFEEIAPDIRKACLEEYEVSADILQKMEDAPFIMDHQFQCYVKCVLTHFGLVTRKGLYWKGFIPAAPPSRKEWAAKVKKHCENSVVRAEGDDLCELSHKALICTYEAAPSEYFMI